MKPTVYLETSIVGYVTSWPSRDLVTAANQQLTHTWWRDHRSKYDVYLCTPKELIGLSAHLEFNSIEFIGGRFAKQQATVDR